MFSDELETLSKAEYNKIKEKVFNNERVLVEEGIDMNLPIAETCAIIQTALTVISLLMAYYKIEHKNKPPHTPNDDFVGFFLSQSSLMDRMEKKDLISILDRKEELNEQIKELLINKS